MLLGAKLVAFIFSNSKAVLASLADSGVLRDDMSPLSTPFPGVSIFPSSLFPSKNIVDLASQFLLSLASRKMARQDARYPIGRTRLEALSVLGCACLMTLAAVEVIQFSAIDLINGFNGDIPELSVGPVMYGVLGGGTAAKLGLYMLCQAINAKRSSDTIQALAEDHINDVWSNAAAIAASAIAGKVHSAWWLDPAGGILISLVIIGRWMHVTWDQVKKLTGYSAPQEFVNSVQMLATEHSRLLAVDCTRAYHFGARYNVEMEIVLPAGMTVAESHDLALELQHKIERREDVERAFVHVDYQQRTTPEHKVERQLLLQVNKA
ncbi:unnamed protein product [Phaeothamnion confervicola]